MPAWVSAAIWAATRRPPSSFTACAPPSLRNRTPVRNACVGPSSYEPNGMSATTSVRCVARATARTSGSSSSTVTGRVVSYPNTLFAAESPTSSTGMPAASNSPAVYWS